MAPSPRMHLGQTPLVVLLALGASLAGACGGDGTSSLIALDQVAPGEDCPAGGVRVQVGEDADGDGLLSEDEVTGGELICTGATGEVGVPGGDALVDVAPIPRGDEACPFGGLRVTAGIDDGANGGVAGDGVLQDGEIHDVQEVCDGVPGLELASMEPPAGPPGKYAIDLSGGDALDGCGGDGGEAYVGMNPWDSWDGRGLRGDHVKVFSTGEADAGFQVPSMQTHLGDTPLVLATDTTIPTLADANCDGVPDDESGLAAGDVFRIACSGDVVTERRLYRWTGTDRERVTGLHVQAGATVTLTVEPGATRHYLTLSDGVLLEGTLRLEAEAAGTHTLDWSFASFHAAPAAVLDIRGTASASWSLELEVDGLFVNEGAIEGDGVEGGEGASIWIDGYSGLYNTGPIRASGGPATTTSGGAGGLVRLTSSGAIRNSGAITARGATGESSGANGGRIDFDARAGIRNSGALDASGADGAAGCAADADCYGGWAYYPAISLTSSGGSVASSGDLVARGGDGSGRGSGGGGGWILVGPEGGEGALFDGVQLSGNVDVRGGSGADGGEGGMFVVGDGVGGGEGGSIAYREGQAEVALYGYTAVRLNGGSGACGGDGGEAFVLNTCPGEAYASGGVALVTDFEARGGDATGEGDDAGRGGSLSAFTCDDPTAGRMRGGSVAVVHGDIDLRGGRSATGDGGAGGYVDLATGEGIDRVGETRLAGGDGAEGGIGGAVQFEARFGDVRSAGRIDGRGGRSSEPSNLAGFGGWVGLYGASVDHDGDIHLSGGDAPMDGGEGGEGGTVEIYSQSGTSATAGAFDVSGGAGETPGEDGTIILDGVYQDGVVP